MPWRCIPATGGQPEVFLQGKRQCLSCCPHRNFFPLESLWAIDPCEAITGGPWSAFAQPAKEPVKAFAKHLQGATAGCLCLTFLTSHCSRVTLALSISLPNLTVALRWLNNCPFLGSTADKKLLLLLFQLHAKAHSWLLVVVCLQRMAAILACFSAESKEPLKVPSVSLE